jgi:hypothetical protein
MDIRLYFISGNTIDLDKVTDKTLKAIISGLGVNITLQAANGVINLKYVERIEFLNKEKE